MQLLEQVFHFFYPPVCGFCGKIDSNYICQDCEKELQKKGKGKETLETRFSLCYFDQQFSLFSYEDKIREKLIAYKFEDKAFLANTFAKLLGNTKKVCRFLKECDIIIPVPIHPKRKRQRGYNQSELIIKAMQKEFKDIQVITDVLLKKKDTKPQSSLSKEQRMNNVEDAYFVQNTEKIKGKKVLLFDDIYTTGYTANACSKVLKEAGAIQIIVVTIAKD